MANRALLAVHPLATREVVPACRLRDFRVTAPGNFDAVIDFDAAMRDPADPKRLRKDYDSGDGLHPSIAGYAAMAAAVPLAGLRSR